MNIGIFIGRDFDPKEGGGYTFEFNFLQKLLGLQTKHKFYVYCLSKDIPFKDSKCVKFIKLSSQNTHERVLFWKIRKKNGLLKHFIKEDNIDILYTMSPEYIDIDCPTVITIWDYGHKDIPYFPEVSAEGSYKGREISYRHIIGRASRIIVGNEDAKFKTCRYFNVLEDKVITNPLPTPDYVYTSVQDDSIISELGLASGEYIFYPAQFWAHKNHIRIIKALKILKERGLNLKVVFSGADKGNLSYLKQKVKEYHLEENVIFAGFISKEQVISLYKNALALVYASLLGPDNLPPLEAMALECPVIVSDITGHRIQLKNACVFFDPFDENTLANEIVNVKQYGYDKALIKAGKELALDYSTENYMKKTMSVFEELEPILECWREI